MSQFTFTFPGGKKKPQKGAAVAGNVDTTLTVPTGKIWLVLNTMIKLTTDATVVDRTCHTKITDAVDVLKFDNYAAVIAASTTSWRFFTREISNIGQSINGLGCQLLSGGEKLVLSVSAGVAGDAYDYLAEYLEIDAP